MIKKVKAFTIVEMIVTMLLTVLIVGLTYTFYLFIIKSHLAYKINNDKLATLTTLDHLLKKDCDQALLITSAGKNITIKKENTIVSYQFNDESVIRNSIKSDTFNYPIQKLNISYENNAVTQSDQNDENKIVDNIAFSLLFKDEKIPYVYHKLYSSEDLFNKQTDAIN